VIRVDDLTFAIRDSSDRPVLSIGVDATIQRVGGVLSIDATRAAFNLTVDGQEIVDISGTVQFTLGANGFNLGARGFQITGFSILSSGSGAAPNAVAETPATPQNTDTSRTRAPSSPPRPIKASAPPPAARPPARPAPPARWAPPRRSRPRPAPRASSAPSRSTTSPRS
jgi:hypothetical protein